MLGQRYYFYLFYINALVSVTACIPQILYKDRFNGSLTSLILSTLVGVILLYLFQTQIKNFHSETISEGLNRLFQSRIQKGFLFFYFILSIFSGTLFLNSIMQMIGRFTKLNTNLIFVSLLLLIVFSIMSKTNSILFMLEMTVLFVTPFLLLIVLRFSTDNLVLIDSIKQSLTYFMHLPKMNSVVSSLFVFTGFTNLLVFSQHIQPFNRKHLIIISTVVCLVLYAAYFIPIGYFGLNGVGVESYVWVTTIDSMRIDYFFLERLVIIFILILIGITLMYIIISFHSSLKFFQMMTRDFGGLRWIVIFIIVLSGFITQYYLEEFSLLKFFHSFFIFRIISDLSLLGIFFYASRKQIKT